VEHRGWISREWGESENNAGRNITGLRGPENANCKRKPKKWDGMTDVMAGILESTSEDI